jgi:amidase
MCSVCPPRRALRRGTPFGKIEIDYRHQALCLLSISGLAGLPQLSLPMAQLDGLPLGLSIIGRRGADTMLLGIASRLSSAGEMP